MLNAHVPVQKKTFHITETIGPELSHESLLMLAPMVHSARLAAFDRKVQGLKYRLADLFRSETRKRRIVRPIPNPADLGRVVIKHARRKLNSGKFETPEGAILAAGRSIIEYYATRSAVPTVNRHLMNMVIGMRLNPPQLYI